MPYELLPQLEFLSRADYQHTYYVDLPLKVADVRILPPILIIPTVGVPSSSAGSEWEEAAVLVLQVAVRRR